jgi:hypothetical protein
VGLLALVVGFLGSYLMLKASEGNRMDGISTRVDKVSERIDGYVDKKDKIKEDMIKMSQHERAMWTFANEICRRLVKEEQVSMETAGAPKAPPAYIAGQRAQPAPTSLQPQLSRRQELCSYLPPDPGPPSP